MFGEQVVGDVTAEPTLVDSWDSVRGQSWSTDRSRTRNADAVWGPLDAPARSSQSLPPRGPAASVADSAEDSGSDGSYDGRSMNRSVVPYNRDNKIELHFVKDVWFPKRTCADRFDDGHTFAELTRKLLSGDVDVLREQWLILEGVNVDGQVYALDNRRLKVLKDYAKFVKIHRKVDIEVRMVFQVESFGELLRKWEHGGPDIEIQTDEDHEEEAPTPSDEVDPPRKGARSKVPLRSPVMARGSKFRGVDAAA